MKTVTVERQIPSWAELQKDGRVAVTPAVVFPLALQLLEMPATQASLEVARRCIANALLDTMGPPVDLKILRDERWQLSKFPDPDGDGGAQAALNFRVHYERIKGALIAAEPAAAEDVAGEGVGEVAKE